MKKIILLFSLLFSFLWSSGQTIKKDIERDYMAFSKLIADCKMEDAVAYLHPKFFEYWSKEQLAAIMETVTRNPLMDYKFSIPQIQEIGEVKSIADTNYVKMKVIEPTEMKFKQEELFDETLRNKILADFESRHGKEHVVYDNVNQLFTINVHRLVVATSTDGNKNWKFIEFDNLEVRDAFKSFIPPEILK